MAKVTRYGRQLITHNPYDESIYILLLRTYCEQGNMRQALELYDEMKNSSVKNSRAAYRQKLKP